MIDADDAEALVWREYFARLDAIHEAATDGDRERFRLLVREEEVRMAREFRHDYRAYMDERQMFRMRMQQEARILECVRTYRTSRRSEMSIQPTAVSRDALPPVPRRQSAQGRTRP